MCYKVADVLNTASSDEEHKEEEEDLITVQILSEYGKEKRFLSLV